jgi:hypothetical protein
MIEAMATPLWTTQVFLAGKFTEKKQMVRVKRSEFLAPILAMTALVLGACRWASGDCGRYFDIASPQYVAAMG